MISKGQNRQALLVFAAPVTIDCERRKWPVASRRLFNINRLSTFALPETDVHLFTSAQPPLSEGNSITVHLQKHTGTSFGERLADAVEHLAGVGYYKIVIIGSDCPTLASADIANAFQLLDQKRLVLGPDHRGGCYLIGLHREDRQQLSGICWHQNTDFAELLQRFGKDSTGQLPVKIDLDTLEDLRLLAQSATLWSPTAVALLQSLLAIHCLVERFQCPPRTVKLAVSWQLPPPLPIS